MLSLHCRVWLTQDTELVVIPGARLVSRFLCILSWREDRLGDEYNDCNRFRDEDVGPEAQRSV